jgi:hypothetical protein
MHTYSGMCCLRCLLKRPTVEILSRTASDTLTASRALIELFFSLQSFADAQTTNRNDRGECDATILVANLVAPRSELSQCDL